MDRGFREKPLRSTVIRDRKNRVREIQWGANQRVSRGLAISAEICRRDADEDRGLGELAGDAQRGRPRSSAGEISVRVHARSSPGQPRSSGTEDLLDTLEDPVIICAAPRTPGSIWRPQNTTGGRYEAHLPAQQSQAKEQARLPCPIGEPGRTIRSHRASP